MQTLFARSKTWKIIKYKVLNTRNQLTIIDAPKLIYSLHLLFPVIAKEFQHNLPWQPHTSTVHSIKKYQVHLFQH